MNNKEFIDYIKTQEAYKELLEKYDPYIVYLGGSRANGHALENSDYDLIFITSKDKVGTLGCDNVKINNDLNLPAHALVESIDSLVGILTENLKTSLHIHIIQAYVGGIFVHKKHVVDVKEENILKFLELFNIHKTKITEIFFYNLINKLKIDLLNIYKNYDKYLNSKIYYNLLTTYDLMYNTDSSNLIKKIRTKINLTEDECVEFKQKIKSLYEFYINYRESNYDNIRAILEVALYNINYYN